MVRSSCVVYGYANKVNFMKSLRFWWQPRQVFRELLPMAYAHNLAVIITLLFALLQAYPRAIHSENPSISFLQQHFSALHYSMDMAFCCVTLLAGWGACATLGYSNRNRLGLSSLTVLFALALIFKSTLQIAESMNWILGGLFMGFVYGFVCLLLLIADVLKLTYLRTFAVMVIAFLVALFPSIALLQLILESLMVS